MMGNLEIRWIAFWVTNDYVSPCISQSHVSQDISDTFTIRSTWALFPPISLVCKILGISNLDTQRQVIGKDLLILHEEFLGAAY